MHGISDDISAQDAAKREMLFDQSHLLQRESDTHGAQCSE